jgi:hypothetical protein
MELHSSNKVVVLVHVVCFYIDDDMATLLFLVCLGGVTKEKRGSIARVRWRRCWEPADSTTLAAASKPRRRLAATIFGYADGHATLRLVSLRLFVLLRRIFPCFDASPSFPNWCSHFRKQGWRCQEAYLHRRWPCTRSCFYYAF